MSSKQSGSLQSLPVGDALHDARAAALKIILEDQRSITRKAVDIAADAVGVARKRKDAYQSLRGRYAKTSKNRTAK